MRSKPLLKGGSGSMNIRPLHDRLTEVKVAGDELIVMREEDVMAVVEAA